MTSPTTAAELIPPDAPLDELRRIAAGCTACDLHRTGTQTVFGHGPPDAELVFVGEQPGDREDVEGLPFVGPAGRELDRALEAVGLADEPHLRTNVVKHFKWEQTRGKRRIHAKPNQIEIDACLPWLHAELAATRPRVIAALGATAAKALLGAAVRVTRDRGRIFPGPGRAVVTPTVHPSSILRSRSDEERAAARAAFHDDLRLAAVLVRQGTRAALEQASKRELLELAQRLDVTGRSSMTKAALVEQLVPVFADDGEVSRTRA